MKATCDVRGDWGSKVIRGATPCPLVPELPSNSLRAMTVAILIGIVGVALLGCDARSNSPEPTRPLEKSFAEMTYAERQEAYERGQREIVEPLTRAAATVPPPAPRAVAAQPASAGWRSVEDEEGLKQIDTAVKLQYLGCYSEHRSFRKCRRIVRRQFIEECQRAFGESETRCAYMLERYCELKGADKNFCDDAY